jgi:hypothetical protein
MTGFIPGSRIGTKIRISNGKKTCKYPGTDNVVVVLNSEGHRTNEAGGYLVNCLT